MHRSFPKPQSRLTDKRRERAEKALAWRRVCAQVEIRDEWRCRVCHRRTVKTMTLCPERAEHHHLVPRSQSKALQYDPRNVILVDAACHGKLTRHEMEVWAAEVFLYEGDTYLNAEGPLTFRSTSLGGG